MRSQPDPAERPSGGAGTAVFAGGGAWWPSQHAQHSLAEATLYLTEPQHVLVAYSAAELPDLLTEVDEAQARGNYVAGYLAYEAGAAFGLATQTERSLQTSGSVDSAHSWQTLGPPAEELLPSSIPLAWMGVYPPEHVRRLELPAPSECFEDDGGPTSPLIDVTYDEYVKAIAAVREFIAAGDTYQVNYTVRARFDLKCDPLGYFLERAVSHPVPYSAYLDLGPAQVISLSPELFLRRRGDTIESRPMKGTRPRGVTVAEDILLAHELIGSEKDRAEDLMIVDMVRNDLGRVSRPGTVAVPALYTVEPYGTVWQMSSTVTGQLMPGAGVQSIMAATFPGASITGAPKHHTMEIIRDLEKEPRGVYTGTVGLFVPGGDFTCNLCIRTIVHHEGRSLLGVGSGVVWDSDAAEEYEETLTKAAFAFPPRSRGAHEAPAAAQHTQTKQTGTVAPSAHRPAATVAAHPFLNGESVTMPKAVNVTPARSGQAQLSPREAGLGLFETLLLEESLAKEGLATSPRLDRYRFLDQHLERIAASAKSFSLPCSREALLDKLTEIAAHDPGALVVRALVDHEGHVSVTTRPVPARHEGQISVIVSPFRTDPDDLLLKHKTTLRSLYDREYARAREQGFAEVLFLNRLDRVTEGAITNICVRSGDRWLTPPVSDGLLPGIWRACFMSENDCEERSLTLDELIAADEVLIGNSVRGSMHVDSVQLNVLTGLLD